MNTPPGPPDRPPQEGQPGQQPPNYVPPGIGYDPRWYPRQGHSYAKQSQGTLILVLGILSIIICGLLGPVAWIMGNNALKDIDRGLTDPNDRGMVNAGRILGIVATVLVCLLFCFYAVLIPTMLVSGAR